MKKWIFLAALLPLFAYGQTPFTQTPEGKYLTSKQLKIDSYDLDRGTWGDPADSTTMTETSDEWPAMKRSVVTIDGATLIIDGSSGAGWGAAKLYDFPTGHVTIFNVELDGLDIIPGTGMDVADGGDISLGSSGTDDNSLAGTEINVLASTSFDPVGTATDFNAGALCPVWLDGSSTAADLYLNMLVDDADISALVTNTFDGVVTIYWASRE